MHAKSIESIRNGRVQGSYYDGSTGGGAPENYFDFDVPISPEGGFRYEHDMDQYSITNVFQLKAEQGQRSISLKCSLHKKAGYQFIEDYMKADLQDWEEWWRNREEIFVQLQ